MLELTAGFESMYGMELLASVHWVATREDSAAATDATVATRIIQSWTKRKATLFTEPHVTTALGALHRRGWLAPAR